MRTPRILSPRHSKSAGPAVGDSAPVEAAATHADRRILCLIPGWVLGCLTLPAAADQFGDFSYTDHGDYIEITGYPKDATGAVEIPATITDKPVTQIGYQAFAKCSGLTSVTIPGSVISIGVMAFLECHGLTGVIIPEGVTSIADYAFYKCGGLTGGVTIPASVTSIGLAPFLECPLLLAITVDAANPNYSSHGGVLFDKHGTRLIQCPNGMAGAYSIPATVTTIGAYAFSRCSNLTAVTIPAGVTTIEGQAFLLCGGLTSLTLPASVTSIGPGAFQQCFNLREVTIPASVTAIPSQAFFQCINLTRVIFPASITSIGYNAFYLCTSLASAVFAGDAPGIQPTSFASTAGGFTVYFFDGAAGFTTPTWEGYNAVNLGDPSGDPDGDGLTTYQEVVVYGTDPHQKDTDGDGFNDLAEILAGTSPTDPLDKPDAHAEIHPAVEFLFYSENGVDYRVEWSTNLSDWHPLPEVIHGDGNPVSRFYETRNEQKRFFRASRVMEP